MSTTTHKVPEVIIFDDSLLSSNVNGGSVDFASPLYKAFLPNANDLTPVIPAPVFFELDTHLQPTFKDVFYNRIHFSPTPLDFGTVVSDSDHIANVWNAFENEAHTLEAVVIGTAPDGTILVTTLPVDFNPLESKPITFNVKGLGQLSLVGQIAFDFDGALLAVLPTTGNRSALYYWAHNWTDSITERLRWETEILQAEIGREQRRAKRVNPARTLIQHYSQLDAKEWEKLQRAIWRDQRSRLITRIDSEAAQLAQSVSEGVDELLFDTTGFDFDAEMTVFIGNNETNYETAVVESVQSDRLILVAGVSNTWPAKTQVTPLRRAFLGSSVIVDEITNPVGEADLEYLIVNEQVSTNRWGSLSFGSYRNLPLLVVEDFTPDKKQITLEMRETIQDNGIGAYDKDSIGDRPSTSKPYAWVCFGRGEIGEMLAFLDYCKGRCMPFWWFTWGQNFKLAADIAENVSQIIVENWEYISSYNSDTSRRDIAIRLHNGTIYTRRIVEAVPGLTVATERLSLDQPIPVAIPASAVDRISFLRYCRQGVDEVEIEWKSRDACILKTSFTQLEISE